MTTASLSAGAAAALPITGTTRVFLILGDPVSQVRAPEMFNHLFRTHGIDAVLAPAHVRPADLERFVRNVTAAGNIDGLWLAIPHKTAMVELLDRCDRLGRAAGAVNAARRNPDGSLEGALFDGIGFVKALDHFGIPCAGRDALVVGVGGGGVAIAASLCERGVRRLALYDNVPGRTATVASRLQAEFGVEVVALDAADPAGFDIVVNSTPLGLRPGDPLPFDVARCEGHAAVIDILMKNQPTPLLQACRARGLACHPGYEMLIQQIPEYLAFFGYQALARRVQADATDLRALLAPQQPPVTLASTFQETTP
ncbi:shikimate dehydrogenase family protein [Caenimonas terrae]|uniref:Shikimate dehydrogenase family protein n=1 Tax=Caenimonas terrae TaxID=696074 RepID=A0ABW0NEI5_9BURK